jgi:dolichol-phosphate mannosyltransferase
MSKLSIIIPVYYSADTLMDCYEDINREVLSQLDRYEILLIDDGSGDSSWEICKEIAKANENIRLIKLSRNFGSHAACYAGLVACTGDCAMIKAADLQEPSSLILDMYESWRKGNRVVLATRAGRDEGLTQRFFASIYYGVVRKFISKNMPKKGFDCYLLDRRVIEALKLLDERHSALTMQILWTGFTTSTVSYTRLARSKGKSKWTLSKKVKLVLDSVVGFSPTPVRFVEGFGALFALAAMIWGVILIVLRLFSTVEVQGWTTLMVVVLFSSGMIMLSLGILGEYIWRTFDVAQNRPVYIIEEEQKFTEQKTDEKSE